MGDLLLPPIGEVLGAWLTVWGQLERYTRCEHGQNIVGTNERVKSVLKDLRHAYRSHQLLHLSRYPHQKCSMTKRALPTSEADGVHTLRHPGPILLH